MTTRRVLLGVGVVLFAVLLVNIGPAVIADSFARLSWRLLVIVLVPYVLVAVFDALGWRFAFTRDGVPLSTLLPVRIAGEAFNMTTPTASVGGEAVKALLIRRRVGLAESLVSLIVAKTLLIASQAVFILVGVLLAVRVMDADGLAFRSMLGMLVFAVVAVAGFVAAQLAGVMSRAGRALAWTGLLKGDESAQTLRTIDQGLREYYRHHPRRLCLSLGCHLASWAVTTLETYLVLALLGTPVSLATAAIIDAFSAGVRFAVFMIPAQLGALEGGYVIVFEALGFEPGLGFSFSLIRRLREVTWIGLGFLVLARRGTGG